MISTPFGTYNGDSWEEHCQAFLKLRYEVNGYQEMTAHTNGDLGIEGFTRDGVVFQCYCPDEEYDSTKLFIHQRNKVTGDLKKLNKYKTQLLKFFQGVKIKKWIFLTPKITNKELIRHCHEKATEYRNDLTMKDLLDDSFDVLAHDEAFYGIEIIQAKQILKKKININVSFPDEKEIINWKQCQTSSIHALDRKIGYLFNNLDSVTKAQKTNKYIDLQIRNYIKGQEILNHMKQTYSSSYEKQVKIKSSIATHLEEEVLLTDLSPKQLLDNTLEKYKEALVGENFHDIFEYSVYNDLCREAIASWLIDCPLDFGG
ncbi:hypothetical protein EVJ24_12655 [Exiguobacterium sp. SH1S21]|uniref:hypothetical protein n=1 Tax=Exiguobacterium sp. SH1S21 TaxID=2510953 RepID=UPI00103BBE61|nr:hypothetical protein [Exiguobacterium sp. SH1S21]TCI51974.1 hypothetical protein EVJ24_12655 [Exiguobacterium sp. SH1S21]